MATKRDYIIAWTMKKSGKKGQHTKKLKLRDAKKFCDNMNQRFGKIVFYYPINAKKGQQ